MKYIYKTICPKIKEESSFFECLNAIGILENCKWKTMFDSYIDVLHKYGNGPSEDEKNKKCLLKPFEYLEHNMNNFINTIRFRNAEDKNRYVTNK